MKCGVGREWVRMKGIVFETALSFFSWEMGLRLSHLYKDEIYFLLSFSSAFFVLLSELFNRH